MATDVMRVVYKGGTSESQVRFGGNDDPRGVLQPGKVYEVQDQKVYDWSSCYVIDGKCYNTVNFAPEDYSGPVLPDDIPEQADFAKCGAGKGAKCCAYLVSGPKGAECARSSAHEYELKRRAANKQMSAQRLPSEPFPQCQKPADD
ncbi:MAG: hypothetical protein ACQGVC_24795 [Myxococcota bacterium]